MTAAGLRLRATAGSEWIKFRSVRSVPAALLATAVVVVVGGLLVTAGFRSGWSTMTASERATFDPTFQSLHGVELAQLFVGALGVLTVTGEYTSGLIRTTFAATPQRAQVLAVKGLILGGVVWVLCTVASFAAFFAGQVVLTAPARHASLGDPGVLRAVFGGGVYLLLIGLFGCGVGALLRRTAAALAALFGIVLVLPIAVALVPGVLGARLNEYLPSTAGMEFWTVVRTGGDALGAWPGLAVFALYVVATGVAALLLLRRRDV
ncbi:MAG TPA: ABC transporter permease [Pseudonocardiaceae bacterium]|nr:ABC transporter permease [Pseudonocardiaceae bacterium]